MSPLHTLSTYLCLISLITVNALQVHQLTQIVNVQDQSHFKEVLGHILKPRIVGTSGHTEVQDYIKSTLSSFGWTVQTDRFDEKTPIGVKTFENIVAYSNLNADRYLLIAAHYDSKLFPGKEFLGATDSAVPCAMMLNLLKTLQGPFEELKTKTTKGLLLVFFDGEEAFENWSATDSIYGARHLAQRWENEKFLSRIELFVLLDLLGTPDPNFYSYFQNTDQDYAMLMQAETRLSDGGHLIKHGASGVVRSQKSTSQYFQPHSVGMGIEDDHIPFLKRNVPILHVIPTPFPEVWHKFSDDAECIDYDTVENLNRILRLFVVEYLALTI